MPERSRPNPKDIARQRVAMVLTRIEEEVKRSGRDLTRNMIAEQSGVAASAVSGWFAGKQLPRPKQMEAIAEVLSNGDVQKRREYRAAIFDAGNIPEHISGALDPLTRAREGVAEIVVGVVQYDDVAIDRFFEDVAVAFGNFCGFPVKVRRVPFEELTSDIASNQVHVGFGLWETPHRLLSLRFIGTPIEIGMTMLTFSKMASHLPSTGDYCDVTRVRPVMNEGQASYRVAQHVLGIGKRKIVTCDYNERAFAAELVRLCLEWRDRPSLDVPLVITDELMALKIHNFLMSEMIGSAPGLDCDILGVPTVLADRKWARDDRLAAAHPRYNLSICAKRAPNDEWFPYLEDAWRIFIRGNRDFLVEKYVELWNRLGVLVTDADELRKGVLGAAPGDQVVETQNPWDRMLEDWLFDNELRDFHDEQTWCKILALVRARLNLSNRSANAVQPGGIE